MGGRLLDFDVPVDNWKRITSPCCVDFDYLTGPLAPYRDDCLERGRSESRDLRRNRCRPLPVGERQIDMTVDVMSFLLRIDISHPSAGSPLTAGVEYFS
jgi:hypothetical protein